MTDIYPPESYQIALGQMPTEAETVALAKRVYTHVFRVDFTEPGFALISFPQGMESLRLRRFMLLLKDNLSTIYRRKRDRNLNGLSMTYFDQQTTTRFHLDGAPDESYLMLGYEPSGVQSRLCMADYTRAAHDLNITPLQFLTDYNPMYARGEQQLLPYITPVGRFDTHYAHVLVVNNSRQSFRPGEGNALGVMHQATIPTPDPTKSRVVNSIMLAGMDTEDDEATALAMRQGFLYPDS